MFFKIDISNLIQKGSYIFPGICLFLMILSCTPSKEFLLKSRSNIAADKHYIRVLIMTTGERVLISSETRMRISDIRTRSVQYDGAGKKFYFYPERLSSPIIIESWGSPLLINGKSYRGMLELHNVLGKIDAINVVSMDEYLYGVVPGEISSSWDIEAIKAQSIAARSYAYYHIMKTKDSLFDLDASNNFQVYGGVSAENEKSNQAVNETSGEIASCNNKPIIAYFHSTCGGSTIDDKYVWNGEDKEYLKGVNCNYCKNSPYFSWEEQTTLYEIKNSLKKKYKGIGAISRITFKKSSGRVTLVTVIHKNGILNLPGNEFRLLFPEKKIKSLFFDAVKTGDGLTLYGHGWGHGVGLCQWGARGMSMDRVKYRDILKYYYKGIHIINIGNSQVFSENKKRFKVSKNYSHDSKV